ncbi:Nif3-like dinuclear metal center hexameric protein [Nocardioides sp. HDW12B]|uniref:Nif3-like dinuclear metal center hexameric protein n=1 Tax=Nocardioides sp. HDW12B TaxID=2714939 RepID=UPI00140B3CAB|nr:Nif3-like dinuclear metal center hexameric protein [Nocardioides sp. HDW12B]QIK65937.1 Nif3-like dinuclear metal center hexameric protein [Nocardioides sp. HDW12B]
MRLAEIVALLDDWYDPAWAEPWDAVGLVCGDPGDEVRSVLFAIDPVETVVDEALELGVDLLVVHHPLLLSGVSSVAATTAKGRVVHRLLRGGVALLTAHTNADVPADGVNASIADALGLVDATVLEPTDAGAHGLDKLVAFVPTEHADAVRAALVEAGAGALGAYDSCTFSTPGEGRFRPLDGADPAVGRVGEVEVVSEVRVETLYPRAERAAVVAALRAAHPYEEPAFDLLELADVPGGPVTGGAPASVRGHGRVGELAEPVTLRGFADLVARVLPATAHGVRVAGDPEREVRRVAVLAGSGESLLEAARAAGADVVLTSDLKHHRAGELLADGGPALVDVAHWAAEWTWLPVVADKVARATAAAGTTVETHVSRRVTDPWTFRV